MIIAGHLAARASHPLKGGRGAASARVSYAAGVVLPFSFMNIAASAATPVKT